VAEETETTTEVEETVESNGTETLSGEAKTLVERANEEAAARRRELRLAEDARRKAEKELAELRQQQESDTERLVREAEERGFAKAAPMVLEAELSIAASGRMREPADAFRLLNEQERADLLAITDGEARRQKAGELVESLLEARPYMALETERRQESILTPGPRTPERPAADEDEWLRRARRRA
jgi:hypothetical protein